MFERTTGLIVALSAALSLAGTPAWSLDVLLGNDDSCNSEGINTLADVFEAAGHTVTVYAPAGEQSGVGSSVSTNVFTAYDISNVGFSGPTPADNRFCVRVPTESPEEGVDEEVIASASPRDAVMVGLAVLGDNIPDLVITGINDGSNTGLAVIGSGTVGGALAAVREGIPAIAVSRFRDEFNEAGALSYQQVAEFVVSVVDQLESNRTAGGALLPAGTGLNINFPARSPRGVVHTTLGPLNNVRLGPEATGEVISVSFGGFVTLEDLVGEEAAAALDSNPDATVADFAEAGLDVEDEASMHVAGYITITTLDGDLTAKRRQRELLQVQLRGLQ